MYGMELSLQVCDAYNEVQRIKEELLLLPREMQAHLQYWLAVIDKQDNLINILVPPAAAAASATGVAQQLQAGGMQVKTALVVTPLLLPQHNVGAPCNHT